MESNNDTSSNWQQQNKRNTKRLKNWTLAWVISMAIANFGAEFFWGENIAITSLAILANILIGIGMILANKAHFNGLDEMQQRIQLNAMALTLGVGLVIGLGYSNLAVNNVITFDAEISHLVIVMAITYLIGNFIGVRQYK